MEGVNVEKKKLANGKGGNENLSPKQKRAFVKMLSKFIRLVPIFEVFCRISINNENLH